MRIAITQRVLQHKGRAYDSLEQSWWGLLRSHQLIPIPNTPNQNLTQTLDAVDLIILSGGDGNNTRVNVESEIFNYVDEHKTPVLGVCRGMHLVARKYGLGTVPVDDHMDTKHTITMSGKEHVVPSHHTIAVLQGANIEVIATDKRNYVEAFQVDNYTCMQWHPERMQQPLWPKNFSL
jgi:N5-(cytidine 5'-diphosphoramidyl)-L-glutamine hydrolase